jgi:hypothetical protein
MAQAARSLSPKQIQERTQLHRQAVMLLARRSARKAIEARLKAQGVKVSFVPLYEINALANDYLAEHRAFFVAEAKQAIASWPGFARWRLPCANIKTNEQSREQPKSITSAVRNSCSE